MDIYYIADYGLYHTTTIGSESASFSCPPVSGVIHLALTHVGIYTEQTGEHYVGAEFIDVVDDGQLVDVGEDDVQAAVIVGAMTEADMLFYTEHAQGSAVFTVFSGPYGDTNTPLKKGRTLTPRDAVDFKVVALYEPHTGRIAHKHVVTVLEGGRAITEEEAIEKAKRRATQLDQDVIQLKSIISSNRRHAGPDYRNIDIHTGEFVASPIRGKLPRRR
jgi:hypothetical protein